MELFAYIVVGLVTGLISRVIIPSPRPMGLIRTVLIGMLGGMFGGVIAGTLYPHPQPLAVSPVSLVGAFLVALTAVFVVTILGRRRAHV
jgi:uncharacterized membrane protein YeaQ/YmgE (transglycosylase-associated protein family)